MKSPKSNPCLDILYIHRTTKDLVEDNIFECTAIERVVLTGRAMWPDWHFKAINCEVPSDEEKISAKKWLISKLQTEVEFLESKTQRRIDELRKELSELENKI